MADGSVPCYMSNMDTATPSTTIPAQDAVWGVAEAKNRFSELITRALTEGPQRVRRRDEEVVVISAQEFERLNPTGMNFIENLMSSPSFEGLDLERNQDPPREIDFDFGDDR